MKLDIHLEPAGGLADSVLQDWLSVTGLQEAPDGQVEVSQDRCLAVLVALRNRCYDQGLILNVNFTTDED
jgi:hypothetical protein